MGRKKECPPGGVSLSESMAPPYRLRAVVAAPDLRFSYSVAGEPDFLPEAWLWWRWGLARETQWVRHMLCDVGFWPLDVPQPWCHVASMGFFSWRSGWSGSFSQLI